MLILICEYCSCEVRKEKRHTHFTHETMLFASLRPHFTFIKKNAKFVCVFVSLNCFSFFSAKENNNTTVQDANMYLITY